MDSVNDSAEQEEGSMDTCMWYLSLLTVRYSINLYFSVYHS